MSLNAGRRPGTATALALWASILLCAMPDARAGGQTVPAPPEPGAAERVRYFEERVAREPRNYGVRTQLAVASLDRGRETHDPSWIGRARAAAIASQAIQDNYDALFALAGIENYAHRFAEALRWGTQAAAASVNGPDRPDPILAAALVEAHLGLGEVDEAGRLLPSSASAATDSRTAASVARWLAASGRPGDAAEAFARAAKLAASEKDDEFEAFAEAMAAGALVDAGRAEEARRHLEAADRLAPRLPVVAVTRARLEMTEGAPTRALATLEGHLAADPDPAIEERAFEAALAEGDADRAARHFAAAESGLRRALDAGEIYSLGSLAQLYASAGRNLDAALQLAQRNLEWKRDREAQATLEAVKRRLSAD